MNFTNIILPGWLLILFCVVLWGAEYVSRSLWEPDEARYAYVAREMRETGNWPVPHRHGELYAHKPPLMFWMMNASSLLTGGEINRLSARLPSLLGVLLALWATSRLAALWHSRKASWLSVLILSTAFLFWKTGGMGQIDALLLGLEMLALYHLFQFNRDRTWWRLPAAYAVMGLAILAKGPVGLLVPLGAYLCASLAAGEHAPLRNAHWAWGPLLALCFPAAWLFWAWQAGAPSAYFDEILFQQNVGRAAGSFGHVKPFTYFLTSFPVDLLPWTVFLPAAGLALGRSPTTQPLARRLAAWILFVLVFFSLSSSKRNIYVLLAFPPSALLIACAAESLTGFWAKAAAWLGLFIIALFGVGQLVAVFLPQVPVAGWVFLPGGLACVAGAIGLYRHLGKAVLPDGRWLAALAGTMLALQLCVALFVYPAINPLKAPFIMRKVAREHLAAGQPLLIYKVQGEILALYAHRPGLRVVDLEQVRKEMQQQESGVLVMREQHWSEFKEMESVLSPPESFNMGSKTFLWCRFQTAPGVPE